MLLESGHEAQDFIMNTNVKQKIFGKNARAIYTEAIKELHRLEQVMHFYKGTSEVALLNRYAGEKAVKISEEMMLALQQSMDVSLLSDRYFNVMLAPFVQLWRSAGQKNKLPSTDEIQRILSLCDPHDLVLDVANHTAYLKKKETMIDLEGLRKGFAIDACCDIYQKMGATSAFINLGGDVKAIGNRLDGAPWMIGVQHPDRPKGTNYCALMCSDLSVVTSGGSKRHQEVNGKKYHYILNGKTGYPSESDLKSVTVLSKRSTEADAISTAAFAMGLERGVNLIYRSECVGAIFLTTSNEIYTTKGVKQHLRLLEKMTHYEV